MFSTLSKKEINILAKVNLLSANAFQFGLGQILLFGKGLSNIQLSSANAFNLSFGKELISLSSAMFSKRMKLQCRLSMR